MRTIYLNTKTAQGIETVDEFTQGSDDAPESARDFYKYVREMKREYNIAGINVYSSKRCTNDWKA
jgi:hypothetical protein|tara:strand:- start:1029 stop:1223 length:195 start_codon:yes stop_codon:yes gene_type:complete